MNKKKQILLVEDDSINAFVIQKFLEKDFQITHANSSSKALSFVHSTTNQFDVVLMDINLGDEKIGGIELLKEFRTSQLLQNIPIIAVTAFANNNEAQELLAEGFNAYLSKPVEKMLLIDTIRGFL